MVATGTLRGRRRSRPGGTLLLAVLLAVIILVAGILYATLGRDDDDDAAVTVPEPIKSYYVAPAGEGLVDPNRVLTDPTAFDLERQEPYFDSGVASFSPKANGVPSVTAKENMIEDLARIGTWAVPSEPDASELGIDDTPYNYYVPGLDEGIVDDNASDSLAPGSTTYDDMLFDQWNWNLDQAPPGAITTTPDVPVLSLGRIRFLEMNLYLPSDTDDVQSAGNRFAHKDMRLTEH
jgi:hypothetical protein